MSDKENGNNFVYITGFGPFKGHEQVNASWEAVKLLPNVHRVRNQQFDVKLVEIPVIYDEVNKCVEKIWKENPKLVIHCGVHSKATNILLEKFAYNSNYCRPDWSGTCLNDKTICLKNNGKDCDSLTTSFNVEKMANELNVGLSNQTFACSTKVGNYLCGYIYLNSLDIDCERTLFIHVPPINSPYSSQETSNSILAVLEKCLEQLMDDGKI